MSAHQSHACCSVPTVQTGSYSGKGKYETINGQKTYVTGPAGAKTAILIIGDIFGFSHQAIQGADILTSNDNHLVLFPDWFNGQPFDHANFPPDTEEKQKMLGQFFETTGNAQKAKEAVPRFVELVRSQYKSVEKVFVAGFCWGGKVATLTSKSGTPFTAAAVAHPAMIDSSDASAVTIPFVMLPSKDEDKESVEKFKANLKVQHSVEYFPTQVHGWLAARANLEDEKVRQEYERGYKIMLEFFHKAS